MNSTKLSAAIVVGSAIIGFAIYYGLTENRREFMATCIPTAVSFGNTVDNAKYLCGQQFKG